MSKLYICFIFVIVITGIGIPQQVQAQEENENQTEEVEIKVDSIQVIEPDPSSVQIRNEDQDLNRLVQRIDSLKQANSVFRFGLSIGPRFTVENQEVLKRRNGSISPIDTTLQFDKVDKMEMTLAGVVAVYPLAQTNSRFKKVGFLAKLNLTDFGKESLGVNKVIEGGFGLSISLSRHFAVAVTLERVTGRRVRSHFVENSKIISQGEVVSNLDPTNDNIYVDDNFTAGSISWVYTF